MTYYAKSKVGDLPRVTVKEHLSAVSELARCFGSEIGIEMAVMFAGKMHDFGKYSMAFQSVLNGTKQGVDHAVPGASACVGKAVSNLNYRAVIEAIYGHHGGLVSYHEALPLLKKSTQSDDVVMAHSGKEVSLKKSEYGRAISAFCSDFGGFSYPELEQLVFSGDTDLEKSVQSMLYTRMLYSCLVDADYFVSACEEQGIEVSDCSHRFDANAALFRLTEYRNAIKAGSTADMRLNDIRENVYQDCSDAGDGDDDLLTLTAPTGTGKTLALMNLALRKCIDNDIRKGKSRIIVVLPFLSLSDQTESIYRKIIPDLIVDNSQVDLTDDQRLIAARWSADCVITTSVQFFESLFSSKPGDCRKLHNIANSVVIFDEAQTLDLSLSRVSMYMLKELVNRYNCTVVLSTATQPAYQHMPNLTWNAVEISKHVVENFDATRRVNVDWNVTLPSDPVEISVAVASQDTNTAVIFNLKRNARAAFLGLNCQDKFLISTDLCPAHRRAVIDEVKVRQTNSQVCHVISTSCIEAGIDLDFNIMYRELAPLPAIIQSAGRCNRNGRICNGNVCVFLGESKYPSSDYERQALTVKLMLSNVGNIDINNADIISVYYRLLFSRLLEPKLLLDAILYRDYDGVNQNYNLITNKSVSVIVPYAGMLDLYNDILNQVDADVVSKRTLQQAAPITVQTYDKNGVMSHCQELSIFNRRTGNRISTGVYILLPGHEDCYDREVGLDLSRKEMFMI